MPERPVLKFVAVTAAVTAVVSGLIGAGINAYLTRARPQLTVTSVGFRGPLQDAPIPLPDDIVAMSTDSFWMPSLARFETFEKLIKAEQTATETIDGLRQSLRGLEAWKSQSINLPKQIDAANDSALQLLKQHPLLKDDVFIEAAIGLIRRRSMGTPPETASILRSRPILFDIYLDQKNPSWLVLLDTRSIRISFDKMPDSITPQLELLALSISRGSMANIEFYSTKVFTASNTDMNSLVTLRDALRTFILPHACLSVVVSVHNTGGSSITFRPFFALRLLHQEYRNKPYVVAIDPPRENRKNPFSLTSGGFTIAVPSDEVQGKQVLSQPYLPETSSAPYTVIPAGETREIVLAGTEPLGNDAAGIKAIHATGLLTCQIVGTTLSGKNFSSQPAAFTQKVDEEERKRLAALRPSE